MKRLVQRGQGMTSRCVSLATNEHRLIARYVARRAAEARNAVSSLRRDTDGCLGRAVLCLRLFNKENVTQ